MDGVLRPTWCVAGFIVAIGLLLIGAYKIRDEEIPWLAVITAAFFVSSSIHVPLPGTSVHLVLNSLVGVILGRRAAVSIVIGLVLQMALLGHGGLTTLGVNTCVLTLPALGAWSVFRIVRRQSWLIRPKWAGLVGLILGGLTVMVTAALNFVVLWLGAVTFFLGPATAAFLSHLAVAAVEALITASTLSFLVKVKPEVLGIARADATAAETGTR